MKSHKGNPITAHVTLGQKQLNGTLGLRQSIKRRRTGRIHNKNGGRRGPLHPSHDPEIISAYLDQHRTTLTSTQSLPWHRCTQGRDQIQTGSTSRVSPNRSIGPPSTRISPYRSNPTRALLRGGPASGLPRICGLRQQTGRQCGANGLKYHFG
jgi:hypothetical protein